MSGAKTRDNFKLGLEIEHFIVQRDSLNAVSYYPKSDQTATTCIESVLKALKPNYTSFEFGIDRHLIGLSRENIAISLEPGGQLETSIGPFLETAQFEVEYAKFIFQITPILQANGCELYYSGYHPTAKMQDVKIIPKQRYIEMDAFLANSGKYGQNMMRCSASTQVSFDFSDEVDLIKKLRVSYMLSPILQYYFRNTPVFEGKKNTDPLIRNTMWHDLDSTRTGIIPGLFTSNFSVIDYSKYVLNSSFMTVNHLDITEEEFLLSTMFNDVRLKKYIELRSVDSLPINRAIEYLEIVKHAFYDEENLDFLTYFCANFTENDYFNAIAQLSQNGDLAVIYGKSYEYWADYLDDLKMPEVLKGAK